MESWDSALSQFPDKHNNTTQGGGGGVGRQIQNSNQQIKLNEKSD